QNWQACGVETYKQQFIEFMVRSEVLTFGDFVTKSGRSTPYFVNTGKYRTGMQMERLGEFYADSIEDFVNESGQGIDVLFGPAYKGIPLVVTASIALARRGRDVAFTFNRKEAKDHGEGGVLVGHTPIDGDRVLWVEDVTSAGTSIRETVPVVQAAADIELTGLVVSVDRAERGTGELSGLAQAGADFGMATFSIITVHDVIEHLADREIDGEVVLDEQRVEAMHTYLSKWGAG
ncbi:MAG: orotate phosphoribosyltransferase, partial [Acidimicrobiales bacterium]